MFGSIMCVLVGVVVGAGLWELFGEQIKAWADNKWGPGN